MELKCSKELKLFPNLFQGSLREEFPEMFSQDILF